MKNKNGKILNIILISIAISLLIILFLSISQIIYFYSKDNADEAWLNSANMYIYIAGGAGAAIFAGICAFLEHHFDS